MQQTPTYQAIGINIISNKDTSISWTFDMIWHKEKDTTSFLWYSCQKCITSLQSQENVRQTQVFGFVFLQNITQNIWSVLFKISQSWKPRKKTEEMLQNAGDLRRNKNCSVVFQVRSWMKSWNSETTLVGKWVKFK